MYSNYEFCEPVSQTVHSYKFGRVKLREHVSSKRLRNREHKKSPAACAGLF
jgi:hypothetical protein